MKKISAYIILSLGLFVTANTVQAQKQTPPAGGTPKDFVLPSKKQSSLPNGMHTTMVQYGEIPKVYVSLIIKTGSVHEAADQVWLSDLLANLMDEGTTSMSAQALAKKAAGMGGEINVNAGSDQFTISGSALSEYAPELVKMIADIAINPALPASEIDRLKNDLKRQLAINKSVPQSIAQEKFFQVMYGDSPYGRIYPTEEMLSSYTLDAVKKFYDDNIGAKRSVLYVAGKFDEAATNKAITESFTKWKSGAEASYPSSNNNVAAGTTIINRKDAPQTTVLIGLPTITPKNPDYLPVTIMNALLGGSFASRITSNIRENKGYTYSPFSTFSTHPNAAVWYEEADITSEHTIDALNEIKKEITRLQSEAPATEELAGIQRYTAGIFVLQNSSPGGIISQLNFLDLYGLDDSYLTNRVKNIYAVTPQQVTNLTKKYLLPEKMAVVMVGDEDAIKQQQAKQ
jgi:predicted Zn-dependent peptidase